MTVVRNRLLPVAVTGLLVLNGIAAGVGLVAKDGPASDGPASVATAPAVRAGTSAPEVAPVAPSAASAARQFLHEYVEPDGRVVRRDQGGDTVSEGQAYGMLVAVGLRDRGRFDLIWGWTDAHLRRADGLLSWRWAQGAVVDEQPAADADLDAAWALALAERAWPEGAYGEAARSITTALVVHETHAVDGDPVLAAGPWAVEDAGDDEPLVVNPSYAAPVAGDVLIDSGHLDGADAERFGTGDRAIVADLVAAHGAPPDWAAVRPDGSVAPSDAGGTDEASSFGWDAVRVPLRYAPSCDPADRAVAAAIWPAMEAGAGVGVMGDHPARLVGAAAAAASAGDPGRARALLAEAAERDQRSPTYYGGALTALGQLLLTTNRLGGCPPLAGR